jgi:hypothetical protein
VAQQLGLTSFARSANAALELAGIDREALKARV